MLNHGPLRQHPGGSVPLTIDLRELYAEFIRKSQPNLQGERFVSALEDYIRREELCRVAITQEAKQEHPDWDESRLNEMIYSSIYGAMHAEMQSDLREIAQSTARLYSVQGAEFQKLRRNFAEDARAQAMFDTVASQIRRGSGKGWHLN
jgi:hypothetical protein